ncbi:flagellar hook-associated protein FlgL [Stutzerimonas tarimensis]|uniref:Flagellar hook-associated protein FlgL n=1 Tax=Stutzerimonas tarimensis TaxID=1507735 RepID=A0ABV7T2G5_9GAMM
MRISTLQAFNNGVLGIQRNYANVSRTQEQIASGNRILTPADDPVASVRLLQLEQQQGLLAQYSGNLSAAKNSLTLEETTLDAVNTNLQRIRELTLQAGSGALSSADRKAIASELKEREDELFSLMNSKNARGEYLFSGFQGKTQPYVREADGTYRYQGDEGQRTLQVASSLSMPISDNGMKLFENITNAGRFETAEVTRGVDISPGEATASVVSDAAAQAFPSAGITLRFRETDDGSRIFDVFGLANGERLSGAGGIDLDSLEDATFDFRGVSITFDDTQGAGDELTVRLSSLKASPGLVTDEVAFHGSDPFPAAGIVLRFGEQGRYDVYAADAADGDPPLQSGLQLDSDPLTTDTLVFRGVTVQLDGLSSAGDEVLIRPDNDNRKQGILNTVATLRKALEDPESSNADLRDNIALALTNLDHGMVNVDLARGEIGARLNVIDTTHATNEDMTLYNTSVQAELRELDYAEALSRLSFESVIMEAAQQSYVKISGLTLFNHMR